MKRIHQTVTDEAYAIYMGFVDKKIGLSAALMIFSVIDVPGEAFKKLLLGDDEGFKQIFKQNAVAQPTFPSLSKTIISLENDNETVEFDPFAQL